MTDVTETNITIRKRRRIQMQMRKTTCAASITRPPEVYLISEDLYLVSTGNGFFSIELNDATSSLVYELSGGFELGELDKENPGATIKLLFNEANISMGSAQGNAQNRICSLSLLTNGRVLFSEYALSTSPANACTELDGIYFDDTFIEIVDIDIGGTSATHLFAVGVNYSGHVLYYSTHAAAYDETAFPDYQSRFSNNDFLKVFAFDWAILAINQQGGVKVALHITKNSDPYYQGIQSSIEQLNDIKDICDSSGCIVLKTLSGRLSAYAKVVGTNTQIISDLNSWSDLYSLRITPVGFIGVKNPTEEGQFEWLYTSQISPSNSLPHPSFVEIQADTDKWNESNLWGALQHNGTGFYALAQIGTFIYTTGMDSLIDFDYLQLQEYGFMDKDGGWAGRVVLLDELARVEHTYYTPATGLIHKLAYINTDGYAIGLQWVVNWYIPLGTWEAVDLFPGERMKRIEYTRFGFMFHKVDGMSYYVWYKAPPTWGWAEMLEHRKDDIGYYDIAGFMAGNEFLGMNGEFSYTYFNGPYQNNHRPGTPVSWAADPYFEIQMGVGEFLSAFIGAVIYHDGGTTYRIPFFQTNKGRIFTKHPESLWREETTAYLQYSNAYIRVFIGASGEHTFGLGWQPDGGAGNLRFYPESGKNAFLSNCGVPASDIAELDTLEVVDISLLDHISASSLTSYGIVLVLADGGVRYYGRSYAVVKTHLQSLSGTKFIRVCGFNMEGFFLFTEDRVYSPDYFVPAYMYGHSKNEVWTIPAVFSEWYSDFQIERSFQLRTCSFDTRKKETIKYYGHDKLIILHDQSSSDVAWFLLQDDGAIARYTSGQCGRFANFGAFNSFKGEYKSIFWTDIHADVGGVIGAVTKDGKFEYYFEDNSYRGAALLNNYQADWDNLIKVRLNGKDGGLGKLAQVLALRADGSYYVGDAKYYIQPPYTADQLYSTNQYTFSPDNILEPSLYYKGIARQSDHLGDQNQRWTSLHVDRLLMYHIVNIPTSGWPTEFWVEKGDGIIDVVSTQERVFTLLEDLTVTSVDVNGMDWRVDASGVIAIMGCSTKRAGSFSGSYRYLNPESQSTLIFFIFENGSISAASSGNHTIPGVADLLTHTNADTTIEIPLKVNTTFTKPCLQDCEEAEACVSYGELNEDDGTIHGPYQEDCPEPDRDCYKMQMSTHEDREQEFYLCMEQHASYVKPFYYVAENAALIQDGKGTIYAFGIRSTWDGQTLVYMPGAIEGWETISGGSGYTYDYWYSTTYPMFVGIKESDGGLQVSGDGWQTGSLKSAVNSWVNIVDVILVDIAQVTRMIIALDSDGNLWADYGTNELSYAQHELNLAVDGRVWGVPEHIVQMSIASTHYLMVLTEDGLVHHIQLVGPTSGYAETFVIPNYNILTNIAQLGTQYNVDSQYTVLTKGNQVIFVSDDTSRSNQTFSQNIWKLSGLFFLTYSGDIYTLKHDNNTPPQPNGFQIAIAGSFVDIMVSYSQDNNLYYSFVYGVNADGSFSRRVYNNTAEEMVDIQNEQLEDIMQLKVVETKPNIMIHDLAPLDLDSNHRSISVQHDNIYPATPAGQTWQMAWGLF